MPAQIADRRLGVRDAEELRAATGLRHFPQLPARGPHDQCVFRGLSRATRSMAAQPNHKRKNDYCQKIQSEDICFHLVSMGRSFERGEDRARANIVKR